MSCGLLCCGIGLIHLFGGASFRSVCLPLFLVHPLTFFFLGIQCFLSGLLSSLGCFEVFLSSCHRCLPVRQRTFNLGVPSTGLVMLVIPAVELSLSFAISLRCTAVLTSYN